MARRALAAALVVALPACAGGPTPRQREAAEIHTNLGIEALRAGRPQDALREFDEALRADDIAEAHLGRGLVLEFAHGRRGEAEKEYRRALELKPGYSEAHNNLGQLLAGTGRLQEAVREFDRALDNMYYREPYVARCNKGQALWQLGRRDEALAEMQGCIAQNPRYCKGHREMGRMRLEEGKAREALAAFEKYARACEKEADAFLQVGLAHLKLGDADGARGAFARCEELAGAGDLAAECRRSRELLK